jgi:hypothetical protein
MQAPSRKYKNEQRFAGTIFRTRSIPRALLRELRISELCSMMMQTILICIADMDITVAMCAIGF